MIMEKLTERRRSMIYEFSKEICVKTQSCHPSRFEDLHPYPFDLTSDEPYPALEPPKAIEEDCQACKEIIHGIDWQYLALRHQDKPHAMELMGDYCERLGTLHARPSRLEDICHEVRDEFGVQIGLSLHLRTTLNKQGLGLSQTLEDKVCRELAQYCSEEINFEMIKPADLGDRPASEEEEEEEEEEELPPPSHQEEEEKEEEDMAEL